MNNGKILIIDSGLGGLSYYQAIFSHLLQLPLKIRLDYLADNKAFPYGSKSNHDLIQHFTYLAQALSRLESGYDFIVIACNTASLYGYTIFTQFFQKEKIIITTPDLYIQTHPSHAPFLLMATSATCRAYQHHTSLELLPADKLVAWIEKEQHTLTLEAQLSYLKTFWQEHLYRFEHGSIILGCTHFLHIKKLLENFVPSSVHLVDTTVSVAEDLKARILHTQDLFSEGQVSSGTLYLTQYGDQKDEFYYKKIAGEYNFEFSNQGLL